MIRLLPQHVLAVTHGHERAAEWMAVDRASNLHETSSAKKRNRFRPNHICPAALAGLFLQHGVKSLIEHASIISSLSFQFSGPDEERQTLGDSLT
jgi:hypothetical protein